MRLAATFWSAAASAPGLESPTKACPAVTARPRTKRAARRYHLRITRLLCGLFSLFELSLTQLSVVTLLEFCLVHCAVEVHANLVADDHVAVELQTELVGDGHGPFAVGFRGDVDVPAEQILRPAFPQVQRIGAQLGRRFDDLDAGDLAIGEGQPVPYLQLDLLILEAAHEHAVLEGEDLVAALHLAG